MGNRAHTTEIRDAYKIVVAKSEEIVSEIWAQMGGKYSDVF
jgi:hypothetical protein